MYDFCKYLKFVGNNSTVIATFVTTAIPERELYIDDKHKTNKGFVAQINAIPLIPVAK